MTMAKLTIFAGGPDGQAFTLEPGGDRVLGRNEECDIAVVDGAGVSRRHAVFTCTDGQWTIKDQDSQNGIYCNGVKVAEHPLDDGDALVFGEVKMRFNSADQSVAAADTVDGPAAPVALDLEDTVDGEPHVAEGAPAVAEPTAAAEAAEPTPAPATAVPAPAPLPKDPEPLPKQPDPLPSAPARAGANEELGDVSLDDVDDIRATVAAVEDEFRKVIVGQQTVLEQLMISLLASGHCLMIGLPGLAKTLMIQTLSRVLELQFKRIQFTPDLMPSDIIGTDVLEIDEESSRKAFRFVPGPVFTNMLLADEINRTPPKTQAALLEAMQERQVTAANNRYELPQPFFVLATQNPLEQEGTYPLPEAQLDRFMFNINVDYPDESEEEAIVMATTKKQDVDIKPVLSGSRLLALQALVRELPVSPHVVKYATRLVRSTRPGDARAPEFISENLSCGAGPRAAQFLVLGAKARALMGGRLNVACDDVRHLALPVLRHRLFTNFNADSEGVTSDDLIRRLLLSVAEPGQQDY
jgi:MoxR-like ATPase